MSPALTLSHSQCEEYLDKSPSSCRSHSQILHRDVDEVPHLVVKGEGLVLTLSNGTRIIDATGGAAVACLGHGANQVQKAVSQQMSQFSYCHSLFFSSDAMEQLGAELIQSTNGKMEKVYILSSGNSSARSSFTLVTHQLAGSEAMDAAMKLARQYFMELESSETTRTKFIARRQSYHGNTIGSLAMSGHLARRKGFEPILTGCTTHVSPCNAYRGLRDYETLTDYVARLAEELEEEFQRLGPENVCAFVAEPVVGAVRLLHTLPAKNRAN